MAKWTKEDDEMLRAAVCDGLPPSQIEIDVHSPKSIYSRMNRLGLSTDRFVSKKTDTFALRKCLPCGKTFGSQHVGNRICPQCADTFQRYAA